MSETRRPVSAPAVSATKTHRGDPALVMVTAYDYHSARLADKAGADLLLVGDSLGMVCQGLPDTLQVTVDDVVYHSRSVARAQTAALVVADLPWLSYHVSIEESVRNAGRCIQEGHAGAVKLEGGEKRVPVIKALLDAEIPVMGHLGLTPQSVHAMGGFKVQGRDAAGAAEIVEEAQALQESGVFALVLEGMPGEVAAEVTTKLDIPTIGIGAGPSCDGQVLVWHDVLGITPDPLPRFVRRYEDLATRTEDALKHFARDVRSGAFPSSAESYKPSRRPLSIKSGGA